MSMLRHTTSLFGVPSVGSSSTPSSSEAAFSPAVGERHHHQQHQQQQQQHPHPPPGPAHHNQTLPPNLTSLEALNGLPSMPSTFLPSYYPERQHHLLPSYLSRPNNNNNNNSQLNRSGGGDPAASAIAPSTHLLEGIEISDDLTQSPQLSPNHLSSSSDLYPQSLSHPHIWSNPGRTWQPKDSGPWKEVPLFDSEAFGAGMLPSMMGSGRIADPNLKSTSWLGDLYGGVLPGGGGGGREGGGGGSYGSGREVTAEEYTQALAIYEHLLSSLPFIRHRDSTNQSPGLQPLIALAAEGVSIVSPTPILPSGMSSTPLTDRRDREFHPPHPNQIIHPAPPNATKRAAREVKDTPVCLGCGATETPEWRRGPLGPRTLCNACGLVHMKMLRKKRKQEEAANSAQKNGARAEA